MNKEQAIQAIHDARYPKSMIFLFNIPRSSAKFGKNI